MYFLNRLLKNASEARAAIKIFDVNDAENLTYPLYELLSTIYIQSLLDPISERSVFKFSHLEMAGLYTQGDNSNFFMIFDGAKGQSIDSLCNFAMTDQDEFMIAVNQTAVALAQLHSLTEGELSEKAQLQAIAGSYVNASVEIVRRLGGTSEGDEAEVTKRFSDVLEKIEAFKERMISEDGELETSLRNLSLTHGDAHAGNIFYDSTSGQVTFIDYETALKSFRKDADPLKDLGCFMGSVWLKLASLEQYDRASLYQKGEQVRENFIRAYMEHKNIDSEFLPKVAERVKFYMWARLFYSGELTGCSSETIERIHYFLEHEFEE